MLDELVVGGDQQQDEVEDNEQEEQEEQEQEQDEEVGCLCSHAPTKFMFLAVRCSCAVPCMMALGMLVL